MRDRNPHSGLLRATRPNVRTAVVVPSFRGAWRVQRLFESIDEFDADAWGMARFVVVEDPSDADAARLFDKTMSRWPSVIFSRLAQWSNMHGAAQAAFRMPHPEVFEWVVYLGDDLLVTPGALSNVLYFLRENTLQTVSLVQIPYWNALALLPSKEDMYCRDPGWLRNVPRNPHWDGDGIARPYVNVNGAGFACRLRTYYQVGGFAEGTWCLDESISVRTWLRSDQSIVHLPGPPFVHYFGGATACDPPKHDLYTEDAWTRSMGMTKSEASVLSREKMAERTPAVLEETFHASYYGR